MFRSEKTRAFLYYLALLIIFHAPVVFLGKSLQAPLMQPYGFVNGFPHGYEGRLPADSFNIDLATPAYYEWPVNKLIGDIYKEGELPLWNPYQAAGAPLGVQYSTRAFFPYQIIQNMSPVWTWDFYLLGRPLIAAFFTFLFLTLLDLGPVFAFIGGLVYMFSGVFTWFLNLEQFSNSALVLPVLLYGSERLVTGKGRATALLGIAFGLAFLAGQPEIAAYSFLLTGSYFALRLFMLRKAALKQALRFALSFALGFALAAPLLLPFIGYMYESFHLHEPGREVGVADPVKYRHAIELFSPGFSEIRQADNPVVFDEEVRGERFFFRALPANGNWDYLGGYVGITAAFIALSGVMLAFIHKGSSLRALSIFFFSFGLAILLKNFGLKPFLWFGHLPIFEQVWSQRWAGPVWVFCLSVSAALGLQALSDAAATAWKKGLAAAGIAFAAMLGLFIHMYLFNLLRTQDIVSRYAPGESLSGSIGFLIGQFPFFGPAMLLSPAVSLAFLLLAFLAILFIFKKGRGVYGIAALIFLELWWAMPRGYDYYWLWLKLVPLSVGIFAAAAFAFGSMRTGAALSAAFLAAFAIFDQLSPRGLPERHDSFASLPPYVSFLNEAGVNHRAMGFDGMLFPNYAGAAGVHDIRYITSLSVASFQELRQRYLHPEDYHIFSLWFTGKDFRNASTTHKESFLSNQRYYSLLAVKYLVLPPGSGLDSSFDRVYEGQDAWIYENTSAMPRAFVVHVATSAAGNKEALEKLKQIDFTREAVVEGALPVDLGQGQGSFAKVIRSSANNVEVRAELDAGGLLVLSDTYNSGWRAFAGSEEFDIYRVNGTMRGIFLPAGEHVIAFSYLPRGLNAGLILFFLGAGAALFLILRKERR